MAEEKGSQTKPLSEAQRQYLMVLNSAVLQTQAELNRFVAYLRQEHEAPEAEWMLREVDVGFEQVGSG